MGVALRGHEHMSSCDPAPDSRPQGDPACGGGGGEAVAGGAGACVGGGAAAPPGPPACGCAPPWTEGAQMKIWMAALATAFVVCALVVAPLAGAKKPPPGSSPGNS